MVRERVPEGRRDGSGLVEDGGFVCITLPAQRDCTVCRTVVGVRPREQTQEAADCELGQGWVEVLMARKSKIDHRSEIRRGPALDEYS